MDTTICQKSHDLTTINSLQLKICPKVNFTLVCRLYQYFSTQIPEDMESATTCTREFWEKSQPLPVWRKICFAIGGAPYQITSTVLGFFMSIFLLEVAQVIIYSIDLLLRSVLSLHEIFNCIIKYKQGEIEATMKSL